MSDTEPEIPPTPSASGTAAVVSQTHGPRFVPSNFPVPQVMVCKGDKASKALIGSSSDNSMEITKLPRNSVSGKCQFTWLPFVRLWENNVYKFYEI